VEWNSIYKRFARSCDAGVWEALLAHFASDADMEHHIIDSTIIRAHPCAVGAKKTGDQAEQALGRSRGSFSTKIHISVDGLGNPLRLLLTGDQRHDITQTEALTAGLYADYVIADRAYDAFDFLDFVVNGGAEAVIPSTFRRNEQREHDRHLYKGRHLVECFINKIKHYWRVFSRFEKLVSRYLGFLPLTADLIWLR
jgi:transposase